MRVADRSAVAAVGPNVQCVDGGASVSAVAPLCGSADGGAAVTILGNAFADGASVTFGGVAATDVVVVDAHTITAKTPAGVPGLTRIVVTNADGTKGSLTDAFRDYSPMDPDGGCTAPARRRPMHWIAELRATHMILCTLLGSSEKPASRKAGLSV